MGQHPLEIVWGYLRDEFTASFPGYVVTMREPTTEEAGKVKTIWIACPDLGVDADGRTTAPETPLSLGVVINVVYSPSFTDPANPTNKGESHYMKVMLSRVKEQRVLERVSHAASEYNIRCNSSGGTLIITEKQIISALSFTLDWDEPAQEDWYV